MIDAIDAFALAIDTGVLTLIWLVHLVVYPGFLYYSKSEFLKWHRIYTQKVSWVVFPLMLGQLILSTYRLWMTIDSIHAMHLFFIFVAWLITFLKAVPLHRILDDQVSDATTIKLLIKLNGYRVLVWTFAWTLSLYICF